MPSFSASHPPSQFQQKQLTSQPSWPWFWGHSVVKKFRILGTGTDLLAVKELNLSYHIIGKE